MQLHKAVIGQGARSRLKSTEVAMVKRTSLEDAECPIARSLDAIGDWWSLLIIRDALLGARRFGEFQKNLGLAKNILAVRLRTLVDQGTLKMAPASDGSAYQEYVLTPKGRGIFPILVALRQWSEEFDQRPDEIATIMVDRKKGRPVRKLELYSQDGRLLSAADTALKPRPAARRSKRPMASR
jgi:DNA-binding HxlR family transcriptional regulator